MSLVGRTTAVWIMGSLIDVTRISIGECAAAAAAASESNGRPPPSCVSWSHATTVRSKETVRMGIRLSRRGGQDAKRRPHEERVRQTTNQRDDDDDPVLLFC